MSAIQITATNWKDPQNATVTVIGLVGNEQPVPMRLSPKGWQLWQGKPQVDWIRRELAGATE